MAEWDLNLDPADDEYDCSEAQKEPAGSEVGLYLESQSDTLF